MEDTLRTIITSAAFDPIVSTYPRVPADGRDRETLVAKTAGALLRCADGSVQFVPFGRTVRVEQGPRSGVRVAVGSLATGATTFRDAGWFAEHVVAAVNALLAPSLEPG